MFFDFIVNLKFTFYKHLNILFILKFKLSKKKDAQNKFFDLAIWEFLKCKLMNVLRACAIIAYLVFVIK